MYLVNRFLSKQFLLQYHSKKNYILIIQANLGILVRGVPKNSPINTGPSAYPSFIALLFGLALQLPNGAP